MPKRRSRQQYQWHRDEPEQDDGLTDKPICNALTCNWGQGYRCDPRAAEQQKVVIRHLVRENEAQKLAGKDDGKRVEGGEPLSLGAVSAAWVHVAR